MPSNNPAKLPAQVANPGPTLPDLPRQARDAHIAAGRAVNDAVAHALAAGRALTAAKALVPDGQWTDWVKKNCDFSDRHAPRYIALAEAASGHNVSADLLSLSLRAAMRRLTPPTARLASHDHNRTRPQTAKASTALEIVAVWNLAPLPERVRAIDNIGLAPLLQVIPED